MKPFQALLSSEWKRRIRAWPEGNHAAPKVAEDIAPIFGFSRLEINASSDQKTLQVIIDGKPLKRLEFPPNTAYTPAEAGCNGSRWFVAFAGRGGGVGPRAKQGEGGIGVRRSPEGWGEAVGHAALSIGHLLTSVVTGV